MENLTDREVEISHQKKLIETYRKNLQQLELQKAMYGIDVPLTVVNGVDQTRRDLEEAEAKLARLEGEEVRPSAVPEVSIPADVAGRDIAVSGELAMSGEVKGVIVGRDIYQTVVQPDLSEIIGMLEQLSEKISRLKLLDCDPERNSMKS